MNIGVNRSERLTFAFTIYEYISDLIVVRPMSAPPTHQALITLRP